MSLSVNNTIINSNVNLEQLDNNQADVQQEISNSDGNQTNFENDSLLSQLSGNNLQASFLASQLNAQLDAQTQNSTDSSNSNNNSNGTKGEGSNPSYLLPTDPNSAPYGAFLNPSGTSTQNSTDSSSYNTTNNPTGPDKTADGDIKPSYLLPVDPNAPPTSEFLRPDSNINPLNTEQPT